MFLWSMSCGDSEILTSSITSGFQYVLMLFLTPVYTISNLNNMQLQGLNDSKVVLKKKTVINVWDGMVS